MSVNGVVGLIVQRWDGLIGNEEPINYDFPSVEISK